VQDHKVNVEIAITPPRPRNARLRSNLAEFYHVTGIHCKHSSSKVNC